MKFLQKNYIKYALITGIVTIVCLTLMELTGQNKTFYESPFAVFATIIAPIAVLFLAIRSKKKILKGKMTFKQGFTEGFKFSLTYAIFSSIIFTLYYIVVNPGILDSVRTIYGLTGASDANVILVDVVVSSIMAIIFGTILSAIFSFFLKNKEK